jgi:ribosomal protein S18 acetylase RimI-like enzyme
MKNNAFPVRVIQAAAPTEIALVRDLFLEYARTLGFDLCFQGFDEELAGLPGSYAPPSGRLLLALSGPDAVGCVALRPLEPEICEMKRLYVRPGQRGQGTGRILVDRIVQEARSITYRAIRLDAIRTMEAAVALYTSMGFREIPPYRFNPIEGAVYMELSLDVVNPPDKLSPR